ncbi:MAG: hypothetical protein IT379_34260 [Deltaproteobacteria bacterium]|nr:hypothetical protein [Deltaproteobacteria bacterium]
MNSSRVRFHITAPVAIAPSMRKAPDKLSGSCAPARPAAMSMTASSICSPEIMPGEPNTH